MPWFARQSDSQSKTDPAASVWQKLRQTWRPAQAAAKALGLVWGRLLKGLQELSQKSIVDKRKQWAQARLDRYESELENAFGWPVLGE